MKIVLSGGGTGGHIYPALALRQYILRYYPNAEFLYIGTEKGLENTVVNKEKIPFEAIKIQGLKRSLSLENIKTAWYMLTSVRHAKKILKKFQPDIVIGTGGYVCSPVLYAASKLSIPTIIHEQNSVVGVTNKFLAKYVNNIAICFEDTVKELEKYQEKLVLTGNPRAQEVAEWTPKANSLEKYGLSSQKDTVLIFGGSRGALHLNQDFIQSYQDYAHQHYQVLMVTGQMHYEEVVSKISSKQEHIAIVPYLDDMMDILCSVNLVVCRSGATTLAELTALGLPSILIPSPYVTNNHQEKNARTLVDKQAAYMVKEEELKTGKLFALTTELMLNSDKRIAMGKHAKRLGITDASQRLFALIANYINE
ncbi:MULTISPECIES: undecaprenyldiphospho-muramoylpentapeptide beta-N-acetylglucosaminyltransferase [unclassified Granulicatella]|uniref:undecaprenyldiphospho-muramoylpentapeptide beta-N-acetylglucosaminyltransferase n=1 Tax=unclassified Granulicatella TaxID=2630493 RepID=UPI001073AB14|nr:MULTISPECIES: undecaprenyldiphospho-muramoylpentapeptide beta-N-acetylglucosaminyltransferase [unclassified Granulicatella]MBF0780159.1 undecaprenyldiphospho-muramoylpentapeptide beta-N-acetylglucosaminyltransferase [Granulicatella sp. 19428wC4_WM01]TFU95763.1 undecaprenyldiphospho-muramoylpentapeptide beta-N-acetylglucosaminyltransferase [Granulicatella sp. WM01]